VCRHCPGVPFGDGERDEEERHADSVVEAALDVEALPYSRGNPLVGHNCLAKRGVGAGEHDGEHERLDQGDAWQNRHPDEGAGGDGEWQSDAEQPRRESELAP
jgi:hypothetical protein